MVPQVHPGPEADGTSVSATKSAHVRAAHAPANQVRICATYVCTGLPDGIFSDQKSNFGKILVCLAMKNVGKFYSH
jgi:hypothetical protein